MVSYIVWEDRTILRSRALRQGWTDNSWGPPGNRGSWGPCVLAQTQKSL
ncbi:unnamed protein product [Staurois parvus]|uniref:Uncharacterized protein n=1 Tax=Staurois parvus TaxID=386267 RepID=A0ABN9H8J6_9NEOB|nr:unnamed protein product [Staurois parvus]